MAGGQPFDGAPDRRRYGVLEDGAVGSVNVLRAVEHSGAGEAAVAQGGAGLVDHCRGQVSARISERVEVLLALLEAGEDVLDDVFGGRLIIDKLDGESHQAQVVLAK